MLIPDNIDSFDSRGEQLLYLKFKNEASAEGVYVLHSLFTNKHLKNISGELDFLVLAPGKGIFAIEVKHGRVRRENGTWLFENKLGKVTSKKKSPFSQVDGTMNSIRKYLLQKVEKNHNEHDRFSKILFGTGVAFTSMNEFVDFGQEAHSWQIFTRQSLSIPVFSYIDTLSKGWHKEHTGKFWYDINESRPTDGDCKRIIQILRGNLEISYSEINRIIDHENLIEEFTREQFGLLDFVTYNRRCLIEGQAGTGKTIMALEVARRNIAEGKKVALLCFNNNLGTRLGADLQRLSENEEGSYFGGTLHSFLISNTSVSFPDVEDKSLFFEETLPMEFLIQNEAVSEQDKYDMLIVDEAQDLIKPYFLEVFDTVVKGGLKEGNWVMFGDFSYQAIYLNRPEEALTMLATRACFTRFPPLRINCRNTRIIATTNTLITGAEKPEFTGRTIEGDAIISRFPARNNQLETLEEIVRDLMASGIPLEKVTLLSPKKLENTYAASSEFINGRLGNGLSFFSIQSFKGLENAIIILFDFDEISSDEMQRLLYVGISRASQRLYLILKDILNSTYQRLIAENYPKLNRNEY